MTDPTLLLVEDDADLAHIIDYNLKQAGFSCQVFHDGLQAWLWLQNNHPRMVLLDLMLPGMDGLEFSRKLKQSGRDIAIIMLTAKSEEIDKIVGLELGADDYITKPFSMRELVLRIKAVLRRDMKPQRNVFIKLGRLSINADYHQVLVDNQEVALTATEFSLLLFLAQRAGRVQKRDSLLEEVWGYNNPGYGRTVDTHMRRLRQKLGPIQNCLETVRGVGYRLNPEAAE